MQALHSRQHTAGHGTAVELQQLCGIVHMGIQKPLQWWSVSNGRVARASCSAIGPYMRERPHSCPSQPPGSILTTFEQGNIVDRGRGRSVLHEGRGVYDPVMHSYRVPPAGEQPFSPEARRMERMDRPGR